MTSAHSSVDAVLARAVLYRTLSTGFQLPTETRLAAIAARERFPTAVAALRFLEGGDGRLASAADRLEDVEPRSAHVLAGTFARLFGHTARGSIAACETEYGRENTFHQPHQLADISGYYLAFGLSSDTASEVRVDHIACELEFMDFLSRKQALLLDDPSPAGIETRLVTERAQRTFLRDHVARWGRAFATRVIAEEGRAHFGALGSVLLAVLHAECERVGVEGGPIDLPLRPEVTDEEVPMACGSADELIQIRRKT